MLGQHCFYYYASMGYSAVHLCSDSMVHLCSVNAVVDIFHRGHIIHYPWFIIGQYPLHIVLPLHVHEVLQVCSANYSQHHLHLFNTQRAVLLHIHLCTCTCNYVCMYICMYVWCMYMYICMHVHISVKNTSTFHLWDACYEVAIRNISSIGLEVHYGQLISPHLL